MVRESDHITLVGNILMKKHKDAGVDAGEGSGRG